METIRKNLFLIIFSTLNIITIQSQNNFEAIKTAFSDSYVLEAQGNYKTAADKLKEYYTEDSYEINLRLGWLNYMSGNFKESIAFYKKAMDIMPYADEPKFGYIFPIAALGKWDEVIQLYLAILKNSPHNTRAMYYLGTIYYNRAQYDKALNYFKQVVDLYPFDYDGLLMYAWTNLKLGNKKDAKTLFQKALFNRPNDVSAKEGLTLCI